MVALEVPVLRDEHAIVGVGRLSQRTVLGPVSLGKVNRVYCIVAGSYERPRQARRELRDDEKLHPASGIRRFPAASAPYSSAASTSSRSRSG